MKNILKNVVARLLQEEAKLVLKKYKPKIIGITGTVGKTSTKDAVYAALREFTSVRRSPKSFNSELGVPLTILGLPNASHSLLGWLKNLSDGLSLALLPNPYPEWLVLEVGTDRPGDIAEVTRWLKPDITIVTKLSKTPVHVEAFHSVEAVFEEKGNLVRALKREGTLILNADDEDVLRYREISEEKTLFFGLSPDADIRAENFEIMMEGKLPRGIAFDAVYKDEIFRIELPGTLGEHHAYHFLAALLVTASLGENLGIAAKSFSKHEPTPGRMRLIEGIKDSMIIDDTYNSSPVALTESLKTLGIMKGRRIAVLGDMLELGKFSIDEHKKAGVLASKCSDILIAVGVRSRHMAEAALGEGMNEGSVFQCDDSREAGKLLQDIIKKRDVILVKGSQGIRMERVVEEVMAYPEKREKLLVRQDAEWKVRE